MTKQHSHSGRAKGPSEPEARKDVSITHLLTEGIVSLFS